MSPVLTGVRVATSNFGTLRSPCNFRFRAPSDTRRCPAISPRSLAEWKDSMVIRLEWVTIVTKLAAGRDAQFGPAV